MSIFQKMLQNLIKTLESLQTCDKIKRNNRKILQIKKIYKCHKTEKNPKKSRKIQNLKKCWKIIENL